MQLNCVNCGAEFEPDKVSRKLRFAVCAYCGTLHNIAEITAKRSGREYVPPPVFLPRGLEVEETDDGVRVTFRQLKPYTSSIAFAGSIFLVGMAATHWLAWGKGTGGNNSVELWQWILRVMYLIAAGVVAVTGYVVFANVMNRVKVLVTSTSIRRAFGPVPFRPALERSFAGMADVQVKTSSGRLDPDGNVGLSVVLRPVEGAGVVIVSGLFDPDVADVVRHFLLQALRSKARPSNGRTKVLFKDAAYELAESARNRRQTVELACRSCGAPIPMKRIRKDLLAASCEQCGVIQDVRAFLRQGVPRRRRNPGFHAPWFAVEEPGRLVVWQRPDQAGVHLLIGVCVGSGALIAIGVLAGIMGGIAWLALALVPAIMLTFFFQADDAIPRGQEFQASHDGVAFGPAPFAAMRRRTIHRDSIAQIVSLDESAGHRGYSVLLITPDNERIVLLDGLSDWGHALFIEQRIEHLLAIEDVAVSHARRPTP
ncbi:MAG: hypothetical protein H6839_12610 [Planctomycetes bacterium]|nr:hypothetical protein [Planctomycetota bacterium]